MSNRAESMVFPALVLRSRKEEVRRETVLPLAKSGVRKAAKRTLHRLDRRQAEAQLRQQFDLAQDGLTKDLDKSIEAYLNALAQEELNLFPVDRDEDFSTARYADDEDDHDWYPDEVSVELEGSLPEYLLVSLRSSRSDISVGLSLFEVRDSASYERRHVVSREDDGYV